MKIFILILSVLTFSSYAQKVETNFTQFFKDKNTTYTFINDDENGGVVAVKINKSSFTATPKVYIIEHYDDKLSLVNSSEIDINNSQIKGVFIRDRVINLLEFRYIKKEKRYVFNVLSSKIDDLKFSKNELLSFNQNQIDKPFGFPHGWQNFIIDFPILEEDQGQATTSDFGRIVFSPKKNFFLVEIILKNKGGKYCKEIVYNHNFEKINEIDLKHDVFSKSYIIINDYDATLFFLKHNSDKKSKVNNKYAFYKIGKQHQNKISLDADNNYIEFLVPVITKNQLSFVGYFSEKKDSSYKGICLFNIDIKNFTLQNSNFSVFPNNFIVDGKGKNKKLKDLIKIKAYGVSNNNIILISEEFKESTTSYVKPDLSESSIYSSYSFNYFIAIKIGEKGDLIWSRNIDKKQFGIEYSSFIPLKRDDKIYFFINGPDKIQKMNEKSWAFDKIKSTKSNLYLISIDENGSFNNKLVFNNKEGGFGIHIKSGSISKDKTKGYFVGKEKNEKKYKLMKISF